jgi:hypothetical protein
LEYILKIIFRFVNSESRANQDCVIIFEIISLFDNSMAGVLDFPHFSVFRSAGGDIPGAGEKSYAPGPIPSASASNTRVLEAAACA